jgi:FkbM family methyltransferase
VLLRDLGRHNRALHGPSCEIIEKQKAQTVFNPDIQTRMKNQGGNSVQGRTFGELRCRMESQYTGLNVRQLGQIAVIGAAGEGLRLAEIAKDHDIEIAAHADDNPSKIGQRIGKCVIQAVAHLSNLDRAIPIVIASHRTLRATEQLRSMGFRIVLPFAALQVMAPDLFPPHMFYDGLLEDLAGNADQYSWLNKNLADQRSRDVLEAVLDYRQTLDAEVLAPVLDDDDLYAPKVLFEFSEHESYIDGGSYDGDTIRSFITRVNNRFDDIFAFEPDPVTFKKLRNKFAAEKRVHPFHAGLFSKKGTLKFRDDASRGATFAADGEIEMPITTIDAALAGKRVTYIKLNIEGAEIDALNGARSTITKFLPRLAISVYHRPTDLWQIPQLVRGLNADYDLYLRQHDGGIIETVLYALNRAHR